MTQNRNREILESQARSENRAAGTGGLNIATPSDGGFFLQAETSADLTAAGFNNSEILSRCDSRTLKPGTQTANIVLTDEQSRATGSRHGGIRIYTAAELDEITESKVKTRLASIEPKKLTGFFYASDEIYDAAFFGAEARKAFIEEYAFVCQDQVINGSGAGEALGVINAVCTIEVSKESGQAAKTLLPKNITAMWASYHGSAENAVWLTNRNTSPQLDELIVIAGSGGAIPGIVQYFPGGMYIKGAPVIEIEQCATLGTVGDIILADFSQYTTANKGAVNEVMSIHVNFIYAQNAFRFIYFFDGQPRFATPITPYKGEVGAKASPFVTLETRS
jgi:HK97 family phage major capsid protein